MQIGQKNTNQHINVAENDRPKQMIIEDFAKQEYSTVDKRPCLGHEKVESSALGDLNVCFVRI